MYSRYSIINEGEVQIGGLLEHINRYKLSGLVSIGKDATYVISRIEYDNQSDRCVGFVLPIDEQSLSIDEQHLPIVDSFLVTLYEQALLLLQ